MKVRLTFDFTLQERIAIARRFGSQVPACYQDVVRWVQRVVGVAKRGLLTDGPTRPTDSDPPSGTA